LKREHEIILYARANPHSQILIEKEVELDIPGEDDGGAWFVNGILVEGPSALYEGDHIKYKKGQNFHKEPVIVRWPFTFGSYGGRAPWEVFGDN
jgi:hypothetical protein